MSSKWSKWSTYQGSSRCSISLNCRRTPSSHRSTEECLCPCQWGSVDVCPGIRTWITVDVRASIVLACPFVLLRFPHLRRAGWHRNHAQEWHHTQCLFCWGPSSSIVGIPFEDGCLGYKNGAVSNCYTEETAHDRKVLQYQKEEQANPKLAHSKGGQQNSFRENWNIWRDLFSGPNARQVPREPLRLCCQPQ